MRREGKGMGVQVEENNFVIASNKIDEAYTWVKAKLKSLFKLFSESITEATQGLCSFVSSCCEKLREVLSWINAQMNNLSRTIVEAYTWMKANLDSLLDFFITVIIHAFIKAFEWIMSYIAPCNDTMGDVSGNNTETDNLSDMKLNSQGIPLESSPLSFIDPCYDPMKQFPGNNTKMDNLCDEKLGIQGIHFKGSPLLRTVKGITKFVASYVDVESHQSLKLDKFCAAAERFVEWLQLVKEG